MSSEASQTGGANFDSPKFSRPMLRAQSIAPRIMSTGQIVLHLHKEGLLPRGAHLIQCARSSGYLSGCFTRATRPQVRSSTADLPKLQEVWRGSYLNVAHCVEGGVRVNVGVSKHVHIRPQPPQLSRAPPPVRSTSHLHSPLLVLLLHTSEVQRPSALPMLAKGGRYRPDAPALGSSRLDRAPALHVSQKGGSYKGASKAAPATVDSHAITNCPRFKSGGGLALNVSFSLGGRRSSRGRKCEKLITERSESFARSALYVSAAAVKSAGQLQCLARGEGGRTASAGASAPAARRSWPESTRPLRSLPRVSPPSSTWGQGAAAGKIHIGHLHHTCATRAQNEVVVQR